jgi:hypothetical protein
LIRLVQENLADRSLVEGDGVQMWLKSEDPGADDAEAFANQRDGEVGYEVNINGLEDYGIADVCTYCIDATADIACVANDLRYEWELVTGVYRPDQWTYYFRSRWPNAWYPNA